jgi:hypothetical protein
MKPSRKQGRPQGNPAADAAQPPKGKDALTSLDQGGLPPEIVDEIMTAFAAAAHRPKSVKQEPVVGTFARLSYAEAMDLAERHGELFVEVPIGADELRGLNCIIGRGLGSMPVAVIMHWVMTVALVNPKFIRAASDCLHDYMDAEAFGIREYIPRRLQHLYTPGGRLRKRRPA